GGPAVAGQDDATVEADRDDRGPVRQHPVLHVLSGPPARRLRAPRRTGQQLRGGGGGEGGERRGAGGHGHSREPFAEVVEPHGDPSGWWALFPAPTLLPGRRHLPAQAGQYQRSASALREARPGPVTARPSGRRTGRTPRRSPPEPRRSRRGSRRRRRPASPGAP